MGYGVLVWRTLHRGESRVNSSKIVEQRITVEGLSTEATVGCAAREVAGFRE